MGLLTDLARTFWVGFTNGGWFFVVAVIIALTGGPAHDQ